MNIGKAPGFYKTMNKFCQSPYGSVKNIELKKWQHRYHYFVTLAEKINDIPKITKCTKKPVKQNQRFSNPYFNKPEFILLFYFVLYLVWLAIGNKLIFLQINRNNTKQWFCWANKLIHFTLPRQVLSKIS